jgi:DNA-binding NtrC family response regulator
LPAWQPGESPGILIVDDDHTVLRLLELVLQRQGFQVFRTTSGREAASLYQAHQEQIQVALLDVCMPDLDGPQTLEQLRRIQPGIIACFMSGNTGMYTPQDLLQMGAVQFFAKPFRLDELAQALAQLVGRAKRCSA